jgi:hypothetical protein
VRPWGKFRPGERVIILGLPFTGKSKLAAKLVEGADRVLFFDPCRDYANYAGAKEITVSQLMDNPKLLSQPRFRYSIVPESEDVEDELDDLIALARAVKNVLIVFDEVGDYRQYAEHALNKVARNGRHDGLVPIYVSQVAVDIPLTVRRLATRVYSYLQVDVRDIKALAGQYGQDFADGVANSKPGELITWTLPTLRIGLTPSEKKQSTPQSETR